jgi:hypothetical protein
MRPQGSSLVPARSDAIMSPSAAPALERPSCSSWLCSFDSEWARSVSEVGGGLFHFCSGFDASFFARKCSLDGMRGRPSSSSLPQ